MTQIEDWLNHSSIVAIGAFVFLGMLVAAFVGNWLHRLQARRGKRQEEENGGNQEGYIVSAVLGLLALLLGFTFALAVDRFETRRSLVLQEANAIGTSYLRAQLLDEPHRTRMSDILRAYAENRVTLGQARPGKAQQQLKENDRLLTDLWSATAAAFDTVRDTQFSTSLLSTVNEVIDLDASRKAARRAHVPTEVFLVLFVYVLMTAGVLGFVLIAFRGVMAAAILFVLLTLSLLLILDIDRPTIGGIRENQRPMIELRATLRAQPPGTFDRWRGGSAPNSATAERE